MAGKQRVDHFVALELASRSPSLTSIAGGFRCLVGFVARVRFDVEFCGIGARLPSLDGKLLTSRHRDRASTPSDDLRFIGRRPSHLRGELLATP